MTKVCAFPRRRHLSYIGPEALPVLLTAATNTQGQQIQWEIIEDIGNLGTDGQPALPALLTWNHDPNEWVRIGALHALFAIEPKPDILLPVLASGLKDPGNMVRRDAAAFLDVLGKGDPRSLPQLLKALNDPNWQVQTNAMSELSRLADRPEIVVPLVAEKLHDENKMLRRSAAFTLGDLGGKQAFNALMGATEDADRSVREAVFQSLKRIDPVALKKSGKQFH
jgi:HEAT repeat protein